MPALLVHIGVGILPVLAFLAALVALDSYKLVTLRQVATVVAAGVVVAIACYFVNGYLAGAGDVDFRTYSRYGGPVVEELGKALVVVALIRAHRVGFLVDAAILGFAVGTGFAIVENVYYQYLVSDASVGTWIVRGFGTAIMHGACTAIFAMSGLALRERAQGGEASSPTVAGSQKSGFANVYRVAAFVPGFVIAVAVHSAYNHEWLPPMLSTLAVILVLPALMYLVFQRSQQATASWLGAGFDADAEILASLTSGRFGESPAGKYVASLRSRFQGPIVADLMCYLRLHSELALRAKGILMMRESGFDAAIDAATREKLAEMEYLSKSIGATGRLALMPLLHAGDRELWQLRMLASLGSEG